MGLLLSNEAPGLNLGFVVATPALAPALLGPCWHWAMPGFVSGGRITSQDEVEVRRRSEMVAARLEHRDSTVVQSCGMLDVALSLVAVRCRLA